MSFRGVPGPELVERALLGLGIVVEEEVQGNHIAHCPWPDNHTNGDRNPSFSVEISTGRWICYRGCGGGGGSLDQLVQLLQGGDASAARKWLMLRGAVTTFEEVRAVLPVLKEAGDEDPGTTLPAILDYARQQTDRTSEFILKRGFTVQTLQAWGFRYDPVLRAVVIPVYDFGGQALVATIRRLVPPIKLGYPKYLYSPGFARSRHLFAAYRHASEGGRVILVEGPLDAVWLHQQGFTEAVALLGVYCSQRQRQLLARLGRTVILALDNDAAGQEATERLVMQLGQAFNVAQVSLPAGVKDVQELGIEELRDTFKGSRAGWVSK